MPLSLVQPRTGMSTSKVRRSGATDLANDASRWQPAAAYDAVAMVLVLSDAQLRAGLLRELRGMLRAFAHHAVFGDTDDAALGVRACCGTKTYLSSSPALAQEKLEHVMRPALLLFAEARPRFVIFSDATVWWLHNTRSNLGLPLRRNTSLT